MNRSLEKRIGKFRPRWKSPNSFSLASARVLTRFNFGFRIQSITSGILSAGLAAWLGVDAFAQVASPKTPETQAGPRFTDITKESGIAEALERHYAQQPKWWLSGLNLVDLDADGRLDLFLAAHGAGTALALLNDGRGHFAEAAGSYPKSEIHLACDINEDGKLDLQMTWQDGGGKWWINESTPGRLSFRETASVAGQGRANAMIDLDRDGRVDWLHERPGVVFEFGDGRGNFKSSGNLEVAATRNEINIHPADFNGDGSMDLALHWGRYDYERGKSRVYLNSSGRQTSGNQPSPIETEAKSAAVPRFADTTTQAGLVEDGLAIKGVGDVNQDGSLDLLVLENKKPEIYLNDGHAKFVKKPGAFVGMEAATKPAYVSWGLAVVTDFDNDGRADILWNGRNFLWLLRGADNGHSVYMNKAWGIEDKSAASVDDGLCFGDIDGDGDLDIVGYTGNLSSQRQVRVYRNDLPAQNWLNVRPMGRAGNGGAAGAKIRIAPSGSSDRILWFEQVMILNSQSAHSYYSHAQTERHFGLGQCGAVDITVEFYPSGKRVEKRSLPARQTVVISED